MTKFRKSVATLVLAATAITGFGAVPAQADRGYDDDYYSIDGRYDRYEHKSQRRGDRYYRGNARCEKGTGGTIIGAVAGGLLGNEVARRGNKTEGSIIGAAVGALAGRAIDKSDSNCRRRYR